MLKNILKKVRTLEVSTNNKIDSLFSGNYRSAFKGRGIEFADIRPYDSGDDVRDIDWKTSSKQGELYVKTYHESRDNTLFFIIDGTMNMQFSSLEKTKYETLLETFSLIAFSAVKNGDKVGILFYYENKEKIFPPKKGRKNLLKILKFLIEKYSNNSDSFYKKPDKSKILKRTISFLKHSSTIFWLTGENENLTTKIQKNIKILKIKHDIVPIIFSDPIENNFTKTGEFVFQDGFSGKTSSMIITKDTVKNLNKTILIKKNKLKTFFQKNKSQCLFISTNDNIFKKIYVFFQQKQQLTI